MYGFKTVAKKYFTITLGTLFCGMALGCFLAPNDVISGGVSGISTIIYEFTGFPLGISILLMNVPIFIYGMVKLGKKFGFATVYGTIALSLFTDVFSQFGTFTDDILLASVYGGVLNGIGFGLVFYAEATTGGVDIIARVVKEKRSYLPLGKIILTIDLFVILVAMFVYRNINIGLYSIISLWINSRVLDNILEGFNFAKLVFVVSDFSNDITNKINTDLKRGATLLHATGSYTGNDKNVVLCTIRNKEIPKLKDIIKSVDKSSFVLITDAKEVFGEGFLKY